MGYYNVWGGSGDRGSQKNLPSQKINPVDIIGLPPEAHGESVDGNMGGVTSNAILGSMPVMSIRPAWPKFGESGSDDPGLTIFSLDVNKGSEKFKTIISELGFQKIPQLPLNVAFLNDLQISESMNNSYGPSMFEGMVNSASTDIMKEMKAITGGGSGGTKGIAEGLGIANPNSLAGAMQNLIAGAGQAAGGLSADVLGESADSLLSGSMVDFPEIWKGSNYSASYSFTVRLYNPDPTNPKMYEQFILYPLAQLMALAIPISESLYTYSFPMLLKVNCPGLFRIDAGCVTNIDILKGGDGNLVTWQQQPSCVDVKFTINELYETMVHLSQQAVESKGEDNIERPFLKKYFDNLRDWVDWKTPQPNNTQPQQPQAGPNTVNTVPQSEGQIDPNKTPPRISEKVTTMEETSDPMNSIADKLSSSEDIGEGSYQSMLDAAEKNELISECSSGCSDKISALDTEGLETSTTDRLGSLSSNLSGILSGSGGIGTSLNNLSSSRLNTNSLISEAKDNYEIIGFGTQYYDIPYSKASSNYSNSLNNETTKYNNYNIALLTDSSSVNSKLSNASSNCSSISSGVDDIGENISSGIKEPSILDGKLDKLILKSDSMNNDMTSVSSIIENMQKNESMSNSSAIKVNSLSEKLKEQRKADFEARF